MATNLQKSAETLEQLEAVSVWKRGNQRAPHKPLLLLLALARVQSGEPRLQPYAEVDEKLRSLLIEFGPPRKSYHPEYPFWRLQNDGDFWEIPQRDELLLQRGSRKRTGDIPRSILQNCHATGGFTKPVYEHLVSNPIESSKLASRILQEHFPESMHQAILDAVGMREMSATTFRATRNPAFREEIIRIYEHRCAICGFDGRLGYADLAIDAAHVMWHSAGGPDTEGNGIALCVLHHRLFDRGAMGINEDHRVLVSQHVSGGKEVEQTITRFSGLPLRMPQPGTSPVNAKYIRWHQREVFRAPERHFAL